LLSLDISLKELVCFLWIFAHNLWASLSNGLCNLLFHQFFSNSHPNLSLIEPKMPEGSWKCEQCNNINYPFRTKCNRPQCGAEKPSQTNNVNDSVTDQHNQVCVSEPSVWSSTFATPLFRTLSCMPYYILILFLIIFLPSCLLAHSLIYHVLTVTVSPRTVMRVKKVQRRRQGSV